MGTNSDNKRLLKNTLFLYVRMFLTMGISLFTSRIVLKELGVQDFGIYNIVGGTVALFSFINITLTSATSRFLAFEQSFKNVSKLKDTFSTSITVHIIIAFIFLFLAETIGLWFLHTKIVIPEDKMFSAQIVYQVSIVTSIISIIQVPFSATIISHEDMSIYAYLSIYESFVKLIVAYSIGALVAYRLVFYSIMIACVSISLFLANVFFCKHKYEECILNLKYKKEILLPLFSYSGWDLYANMSTVARTHGIAVVLNLFFGAAINAATGVANQVQNAIMGFVENFMTALRPQIVKNYAEDSLERVCYLIYNSSKYSFLLLFTISLPIIFECSYILHIWLDVVPDYTSSFVILSMIMGWNSALFRPVVYGIHATGKIKGMSVINGTIVLFVLPISYWLFNMGFNPFWAYIVNISLLALTSVVNLFQLRKLIPLFSIKKYSRHILDITIKVVIPVFAAMSIIRACMEESFIRLLASTAVSVFFVSFFVSFFVLDVSSRRSILILIKEKAHGFK